MQMWGLRARTSCDDCRTPAAVVSSPSKARRAASNHRSLGVTGRLRIRVRSRRDTVRGPEPK